MLLTMSVSLSLPPRRRQPALLHVGIILAALALPIPGMASEIWVALSSKDPVYLETADALRSALPDDEIRIGGWREFDFKSAPPPHLLVTLGSEALDKLHPYSDKIPVIALLAPRTTLDELRNGAPGRITGVYYEQPIPRLTALLRTAFPSKTRVGVLLGPASTRYRNELSQALQRLGMEGRFEVTQDRNDLARAVQNVISDADVFLALPDPEAINTHSARFILLASYRRGIPVVGYSASFVKAGAAVAMVSSPIQIGREAALMVNESRSGRKLPPPRVPKDFDVLVNASVSRSLGLGLDAPLLERRIRDEEPAR